MTVTPAMVSEPLRSLPPLAVAENAVDPLPVPDAPLVIVIHGALVDAVHEQVGEAAETANLPLPPPASTGCDAGDTVTVQGAGAAA